MLKFKPSTHTVTKVGDFPRALSGGSVGTDGSSIFYLGGETGLEEPTLSKVYSSTVPHPTPVVVAELPCYFYLHSSSSSGKGAIYTIFGDTIFKYNTETGSTEIAGSVPEIISGFGSKLKETF